ncbi:MAG: PrsW family glutamic-type intramembrane protease [Methylocystis sp.]|uniref:PrsW family glutamic-type intramembrane protease n=1 Tax=Methylocystis sp. TaxID=1911079 RepID=UPI003D0AA5A6
MIADSFWRLGALVGSLVPGVVIAVMLFRIGERRLSPRLLLVAIASGAMIAILPLTVNAFEAVARTQVDATLGLLIKAFAFAGLSEEGAKLLACLFIVATYYQRRSRTDLILACAGVGLGFALIENISYVLHASDEWKGIAIARAVSAVPMHAFLGMGMGFGLAWAELEARTSLRILKVLFTWLVCATLHGLYDFPLFLGELLPLSLPFVIEIGDYLSATTPTLLSGAFLFAVAMYAVLALRAIAVCREDLAAQETHRVYRLSPMLVDRIVFAKATGLLLGGLLALLAIVPELVGAFATALGAAPFGALNAASIGVALGTLSWGVAGQEFLALPRDVDRWTRAFLNFSRRNGIAAAALVTVSVSAIFGFLYWSYVGVRYSIAYSLVKSGASFANVGAIDRAISNFNTALKLESDLLVAYQARAEAYSIMQDYDRAITELERAVQLHPNNAVAYASLAQLYGTKHDYARALQAFDRAVELDAQNPEIYIARGLALNATGDANGAWRDADRALELKPKLAAAHALRAQIHTSRDEASQAISEYGEAIGIDSKNAGAYFARGRLYFEDRNFSAAAKDFARAAATGDRRYVILWLFLARAYLGEDGKRELAVWSETTPKNAWPFPLTELYLGVKPLAKVAEAAATNDQKCELMFYAGELQILVKLEKDAAESLARAKQLCPDDFVETRLARKDSQRLQDALDSARSPETAAQNATSGAAAHRDAIGAYERAIGTQPLDSATRDDNVRKYLSSIEAEAAQSKISVALLATKLSPNRNDLIVTARVKNNWNQPVILGELSVDAFRFLNPDLFKVIPAYPESLMSAKALKVAIEPIAAGETKTLTIRIESFRRLGSRLRSKAPSRPQKTALTFYGPSGQRNVVRIAAIAQFVQ